MAETIQRECDDNFESAFSHGSVESTSVAQVSMKEWEIPWNELNVGDILGVGHFGTVYSGNWHGDVAIKLLNMDFLGDETILENFKSEVTIRST